MNFIEEYKKGQEGGNKGIPMGEGLKNVSNSINGIQRGRIFGIAGASKSGKSTFVDYSFLIQPYLYSCENNTEIEWVYFSYEIDRVSKEFDISAFFLNNDFGIKYIDLPKGVTSGGKSKILLSPDYLRGRVLDDSDNIISVNNTIFENLKKVYENRIIPMFGEYDTEGKRIKKGKIIFIPNKENPTGIYKYLKKHAEKRGKFITTTKDGFTRTIGYKPDNPDKYIIVITDHLRKISPERGFSMKQTIDKYLEYSVIIKNWCAYTFAHIIHTNRDIVSQNRLRFSKDLLYPSSDDIKETG